MGPAEGEQFQCDLRCMETTPALLFTVLWLPRDVGPKQSFTKPRTAARYYNYDFDLITHVYHSAARQCTAPTMYFIQLDSSLNTHNFCISLTVAPSIFSMHAAL